MTAESSVWKFFPSGRPGAVDRAHDAAATYADDAPRQQMTDDLNPAIPLPDPDGWTDSLSGANGPRYWERVVANEEARRRRYGRTATVALVELVGFDDERSFVSHELLRTLFTRVARVIVRQVRESDHVARIGAARFGILLVETDEISAINFVDRLRETLRIELGTDPYFRARIGWASPADGGSLDDASAIAVERLEQDSPGRS